MKENGIRDYKNFAKSAIYHIYNRGNNKNIVFVDNVDFQAFLLRIKITIGKLNPRNLNNRITIKPLPIGAFTIYTYCLISNHFHFFIKQNTDIPISKLLSKVCTSYTRYFNRRYNLVGNLWQDTFKAKIVNTNTYFLQLNKYILLNPTNYLQYPYSSLQEILNSNPNPISDPVALFKMLGMNKKEFLKYLSDK